MVIAWFSLGLLVGVAAAWFALRARIATADATAELERRASDDKLAAAERARAEAEERFRALSAEALRENNSAFLQLAETKLQGYVAPLKESLEKVDGQVRLLEQARQQQFGALRAELAGVREGQERLRAATGALSTALRTPHVRGRWGEVQLRNVVEAAGLLAHCDFQEQASTRDSEGSLLRPDLVVRIPGGKQVVVDAKAPLDAYLDALEAQSEEARATHLAAHARQLRNHVSQLARKAYWDQFEHTPEFVVLFVPNEAVFSAAMEQDPSLMEGAFSEKVLLASPTTLIALLRAAAFGWRQERLAQDAQEIASLGRELHKRLGRLGEHFAKLGRGLSSAVGAYNDTVGSFERMVVPGARKLREKAAPMDEELAALPDGDVPPRTLQPPAPTLALPEDAN